MSAFDDSNSGKMAVCKICGMTEKPTETVDPDCIYLRYQRLALCVLKHEELLIPGATPPDAEEQCYIFATIMGQLIRHPLYDGFPVYLDYSDYKKAIKLYLNKVQNGQQS